MSPEDEIPYVNVEDFPRLPGETDDVPRLRRAMDAVDRVGGGIVRCRSALVVPAEKTAGSED